MNAKPFYLVLSFCNLAGSSLSMLPRRYGLSFFHERISSNDRPHPSRSEPGLNAHCLVQSVFKSNT